jgi:hypothetical protein
MLLCERTRNGNRPVSAAVATAAVESVEPSSTRTISASKSLRSSARISAESVASRCEASL